MLVSVWWNWLLEGKDVTRNSENYNLCHFRISKLYHGVKCFIGTSLLKDFFIKIMKLRRD